MKKCGTKTILAFLEEHPQIVGSRGEVHYYDTSDFERDFGAFLEQFSARKEKGNQKIFISKTGIRNCLDIHLKDFNFF